MAKLQKIQQAGDFLLSGQQHVKVAIDCDNKGEYENAYTEYMTALEFFTLARKWEVVDARKKVIESGMREYLTRAENLKKFLDGQKQPMPASSGGGGNSNSNNSKSPDGDKPSLSNITVTTSPNVTFDDIAGLKTAKRALQEALVFPRQFPALFKNGIKPWRGILLYGPPGTGKTQMARAVATVIKATFLSISSSDVMSKWLGQSEKMVQMVFQEARAKQPSVIFVDEIDALLSERNETNSESSSRVKTEFMQQMSGLKADTNGSDEVLVLGATNLPWNLDEAVLRRLSKRIWIPLPDEDTRMEIIRIKLKAATHVMTDADLREISRLTEDYSGSDIDNLVNAALFQQVNQYMDATHFCAPPSDSTKLVPCSPTREGAVKLTWHDIHNDQVLAAPTSKADFLEALKTIKPSGKTESKKRYAEWTEKYGTSD